MTASHVPTDGSCPATPDRPADGGSQTLRDIAAALARASDQKVLEIVSRIDSLADRRAMDAMIAPLRPRIAVLRPARPLSVQRLMFAPFDAAIVPTAAWSPAVGLVPRGMLRPIFVRLRPAIARFEAIEAELRRLDPRDHAGRVRLGRSLWAVGAEHVLMLDPHGDDWAALELGPGDRMGVLNSMQFIFQRMTELLELPGFLGAPGAPGPGPKAADPRAGLLALFESAAACGLDAWTLLLNLLLDPPTGIGADVPGRFVELTLECAMEIADTRPQSRIVKLLEAGTGRAVARLLDLVETKPGDAAEVLPAELAPLLARLGRAARVLSELSASVTLRADQHERVRHTRQAVASICRRRLDLTMSEDVIPGLRRLVTSPAGVPAQEIEILERSGRTVREFAARLHALGLDDAKPGEGEAGALDRWREPVGALLAERVDRRVPLGADAGTGAYDTPPSMDAAMARYLRLVEIMFGTNTALGLTGEAGWRTG